MKGKLCCVIERDDHVYFVSEGFAKKNNNTNSNLNIILINTKR
jgi:hypothetical protein